ncbi:MAG: CoA transferase [Porticoccaceae bacterium]|nr:CoA transferase [Porticoccaceae bacterium]
MPPTHILNGIKVIDFSHYVAGPHCTRLLAQHGAEVIKIERLSGDPTRKLPVQKGGTSGCFVQHNLGKKSLSLDLEKPEAQGICHDLIKNADIVVENFTPGTMKRLNMDWETLQAINPKLIMCSVSCMGQTGPLATYPCFDYIGQAYSGIMGMTGDEGGFPALSGMAFGEISTGAHAYGAIVSALFHKLHGGGGQYLDISLLDCLFSYHAMNVQVYDASNGEMNPLRSGHQHPFIAPLAIYQCKGAYLIIIALGKQWTNLVKLIDREDMLDDPRFADPVSRNVNRAELTEAIEFWLDGFDDVDAALRSLGENHVPAAPVLSVSEVMSHPHMIERGIVQTITNKHFGDLKIPASPYRYSLFPEPLELEAGLLGEHNHEVLSEQLAYTTEQIQILEDSGVCSIKP